MLPLFIAVAAGLAAQQAGDPAAEERRARELVIEGRFFYAVGIYRNLLPAAPKNQSLLLNRCIAEYKARPFAEAITHAEAALKIEPGLMPARLFLGAARLELGPFDSVVVPLAQAVVTI